MGVIEIKFKQIEYMAEYIHGNNRLKIYNRNGVEMLSLPLSLKIETDKGCQYTKFSDIIISETQIVLSNGMGRLQLDFLEDSIILSFGMETKSDFAVKKTEYFLDDSGGMDLSNMDRAFSPAPKKNNFNNNSYFDALPNLDLSGYFSPPPLNFTIGNKDGLVSFGLLDIPNSYSYKITEDFSILADAPGGKIITYSGECYTAPRLIITFPKDEFSGIRLFREKLIQFGLLKSSVREKQAWWNNPILCTYGDELIDLGLNDDEMTDERFNLDWVKSLLEEAQDRTGIKHFNIIIDAFWQEKFALDPILDKKRFGDMRQFVDECHKKGHRVILWCTPLFDSIINGYKTRSQRLNVLAPDKIDGLDGCYAIDYTADNIEQYVREILEVFLGDKEGQLNADGLKTDFLGTLRDPLKGGTYQNAKKGVGMRELLIFNELFYKNAKNIKPDCMISGSVGDPRFEHTVDINRLHDIHCGNNEREMRARISCSANPELKIDSDGAIMLESWAETAYICAVLYATPSLYYVRRFHDKKSFSRDKMKALGSLLTLSTVKPQGEIIFVSYGNWLIKDDKKVKGLTIEGKTIVFFPHDHLPGYIFSWKNENVDIPLYGHRIAEISPPVHYISQDFARDYATIRVKSGVLYEIKCDDRVTGIETLFKNKNIGSQTLEGADMYFNGAKKTLNNIF